MVSEKITVSRKSNDFGAKLLQLQQNKEFCDATLIVNEERIAVHKNVLAASSDYFENVFVESKLNEIIFQDVDKEALLKLIDFCYSGTTEIDESMLRVVIDMANVLSVYSFIDSCKEILENRLNIQNSISTLKISKSGHTKNLNEVVFKFIKENFEQVSELSDFLTLEYSDMHDLLGSDMVVNPMIIYEALKKWMNYDVDLRIKNLNDLLTYVPLASLPLDFLISEPRSLCNSNYLCAEKFLAALEKQRNKQFGKCNMYTLMAVGEYSKSSSKKIEVYDLIINKWIVITEMDHDYEEFSSILLEDKLLLVGGHNGKNIVSSYDIKSGTISALPSLVHGRHRTSVVQVDGNIYAISGYNTKCVERYDPSSRTWSDVASMKTPRTFCQAAVIDNKIYVMGGENGNGNYLDTTECYNQFTNSWEYRKSMNEKRAHLAVAVVGKFLYAVGGQNSSGHLKSAERYDATIDQWTMIASSNFFRAHSAAGNLNGQLVVAGGGKDNRSTDVEIYDDTKNSWNPMPSLNIPRYIFNLVSIPTDLAHHLLTRKA